MTCELSQLRLELGSKLGFETCVNKRQDVDKTYEEY